MLQVLVIAAVVLVLAAIRFAEFRVQRRARARGFVRVVSSAMVTPRPVRKLGGRGL